MSPVRILCACWPDATQNPTCDHFACVKNDLGSCIPRPTLDCGAIVIGEGLSGLSGSSPLHTGSTLVLSVVPTNDKRLKLHKTETRSSHVITYEK